MAKLRTQKDGRLFAIELLKKIEAVSHETPFSCVDRDSDGEDEWEYNPQNPMIREAFDRIYSEGTKQARDGFWVVMTEELGGRGIGHIDIGALESWERQGRMRDWGGRA